MNAQEARELTISKLKTFEDVMTGIETMANAGYLYRVAKTNELLNPEEIANKLTELGYNVDNGKEFFTITW